MMKNKTNKKKGMSTVLDWILWAIFFLIALAAIGYFAKRMGVL